MNFEEYRKQDAVGLAAMVSKGDVSPSELLETAVARMVAVNPKINAVTMDLTEWGRQDVKRDIWGGPMAGVPFLLKDLGAQLAARAKETDARIAAHHAASRSTMRSIG